jgi:hypothetical protein
MCPAFCLTDYKVQGSTLSNAILDIKDNGSGKGKNSHRKFTSNYVQLSRLQSFQGVHLLQEICLDDLRFRPDDRLLAEIERLMKLERDTMAAWATP